MVTPLLITKLHIPAPRAGLVPRPALTDRLDQALRLGHRLTLISAPAGFGKTTLLSEWSASCDRPIAWISLDENDNDPVRFIAYLIAALQPVVKDLTCELPNAAIPSLPMEECLTGLINQLNTVSAEFVMVLDDYHLVTAQPVHDAVTFLIDHSPDNMRLMIATRADPPLPIARLRGRGHLTELRLRDLRFTSEEAAEFLNRVMALELTEDEVAALESRTEGWIAGLQMAAIAVRTTLAMKGDAASLVRDFSGDHRFILDYLIEEVLRHQPRHIQSFLLQTSILDRLCSSLCNALLAQTGGQGKEESEEVGCSALRLAPEGILSLLDRRNLFIMPLDNSREWYRYHRLFADLLRSRLRREHPDMVPALHQRASRWFEQHGLTIEAVDHALAASDQGRAADLVEKSAETILMRGETATFLRWLGALPDALVLSRPTLCFYRTWIDLMRGRPLRIVESQLERIQKDDRSIPGGVAALRALVAAFQGRLSRAVELSRCALLQLPKEEQFARTFASWILRVSQWASGGGAVDPSSLDDVLWMSQRAGNVMLAVMVLCHQAEIRMREGQLHGAAATYRRALDLGTDSKGRRLPIAGQALIGLGELLREWNDLDAAAHHLLEGIRLTEQWTEVGPLDAYIALARVRQAQGDIHGAWEAIDKAQELATMFDLTDLDDLTVALFEAWMRVSEGDIESVNRWAVERDLFRYIESPLTEAPGDAYDVRLRKYELLVFARLLIASGQTHDALSVLRPLVQVAVQRDRPRMLIEIHMLEALCLQAEGNMDQAVQVLQHALTLARPEGYVRIFADEGEPVLQLLQEAAERGIAKEYTHILLSTLGIETRGPQGTKKTESASSLAEPLTGREMEVLRLLSSHLSSTEIADTLFVSANTARFHIKNIYSKLGVHRRSDAVQRARGLGLL
jgi:LuxR family maltose regulon positive regulatory protein